MAAPIQFSRASPAVVLIGATLVFIFLCIAVPALGWVAAWAPFGVGALQPAYFDLRGLVEAANCAKDGVDVYVTSCGAHDPLNYPPIWLSLLQMSPDSVPLLGTLFDMAGVVAFILLVRGRSALWGAVGFLALFSPAILLGFERCNADIIVFVLVAIAAMCFAPSSLWRMAVSFLLLASGVLLKLYPVFGIALVARFTTKRAVFATVLLVFTLGYALIIADYMTLIARNMQVSPGWTYGYLVPFLAFDALRGVSDFGPAAARGMWPTLCIALTLALTVAASLRARIRNIPILVIPENEAGTTFLLGAGIYCGSFLLQANWSYRLIFLLLCLPQIFDWCEQGETRWWGTSLIAAVLFLLWTTVGITPFLVTHLVHWAFFTTLVFLLLSNLLQTIMTPDLSSSQKARGSS